MSKDILSKGYLAVRQFQLEGMKQILKDAATQSQQQAITEKDFQEAKNKLNKRLVCKTDAFEGTTDKSLENVRRFTYGLMRDMTFRKAIIEISSAYLKPCPTNFIEIPEQFTDVQEAKWSLLLQMAVSEGHFRKKPDNQLEVMLNDEDLQRYNATIEGIVKTILTQQYLSPVWRDLVLAYVASPTSGNQRAIADCIIEQYGVLYSTAEIVELDSSSLTIRLKKGLSRKEYMELWDVLRSELEVQPELLAETSETDLLKSRMAILHYQEKLSYQEIAKIYYPEYFTGRNRSRNAIDLVRRTIERTESVYIDVE